MLGEDPPELGLGEGEGLDHGYREEGEPDALTKPLDHPLALLSRAAVVCRQESPAPQSVAQGMRLPSNRAKVLEHLFRLDDHPP